MRELAGTTYAFFEGLTVTLPVCSICQRVGKIPAGHFSGKEFCCGPIENPHKRVRMKQATFQTVEKRG